MTDKVSPQTRSRIMASVRNKNTRSTEWRLRGAMVSRKMVGWKVQYKRLPGMPDFAFPDRRLAIFVDGCFWHGCPRCYRRPHSNTRYWDAKVRRNKLRDQAIRASIRKLGWDVLRIWEHEIADSPWAVCSTIAKRILRSTFRRSRRQ